MKSIKQMRWILFYRTAISFKQYEDSSVLTVYSCIIGSMLNSQQLCISLGVTLDRHTFRPTAALLYTTFAVIPRLRCNVLSMETNGFDHGMRGGGNTSWALLFTACPHMHTHADISPVGSPSFAVNPQQFTPPPYTLHTAQMVLLWFTWQSASTRAHAEL